MIGKGAGRKGNGAGPLDAVVVGAGQAGLALGYHLARRGLRFQILDAASRIGQTWAARWDSLVLFTPAQYDALPGMAFPAEPDTYPTNANRHSVICDPGSVTAGLPVPGDP